MRREFDRDSLSESGVATDPIRQFQVWFEDAVKSQVPEPHAFILATSSPDGQPSARVMLLRGCEPRGFTFFTNYESRKGSEIAANPRAAMVFFWHALERQVRVEGSLEKVPAEESDAYFDSRPEGSKVGAWASRQSTVIPDRESLEARVRELEAEFADRQVPRPAHWGGYCLVPSSIEFWQGRPSRLHDRLRYTRDGSSWQIDRLSP